MAEPHAWALMGMAKTLGERYAVWSRSDRIDEIADEAFDIVRRGLEP